MEEVELKEGVRQGIRCSSILGKLAPSTSQRGFIRGRPVPVVFLFRAVP